MYIYNYYYTIYPINQDECVYLNKEITMSVKEDVKLLLAKEAVTMKHLAELMQQKTGYPYNLKVISDKLARKTLKYEEFKIIADILGYDIELKKRKI